MYYSHKNEYNQYVNMSYILLACNNITDGRSTLNKQLPRLLLISVLSHGIFREG